MVRPQHAHLVNAMVGDVSTIRTGQEKNVVSKGNAHLVRRMKNALARHAIMIERYALSQMKEVVQAHS